MTMRWTLPAAVEVALGAAAARAARVTVMQACQVRALAAEMMA
jgi:hypothetical protein